MAIERYYTDLTAHKRTQRVDEYGSPETVLGPGVAFRGHIGKPSSAAAVRMAQKGMDVTGRLYAPVGAPVSELDVVVEKATGAAFQVVSEPRDAARRGHHVEADLTEWRGGIDAGSE